MQYIAAGAIVLRGSTANSLEQNGTMGVGDKLIS